MSIYNASHCCVKISVYLEQFVGADLNERAREREREREMQRRETRVTVLGTAALMILKLVKTELRFI